MRLFGDLYVARLKRRLLVSCLTAVIGGPVMCVGLWLLIGVVLPALESGDVAEKPAVLVLLFASVLLFLLGVPLAVAAVVTVRRARALDAALEPLGVGGSTYMLTGRHYEGHPGGRAVHVYAYRGPTVEVRLRVPVQAAFRVVAKEAVSSLAARTSQAAPVPVGDALLEPFTVYAPDDYWVRDLFAYRSATEAISYLMTSGAPWAVFRSVELQPGELVLHLYGSRGWFSPAISGAEVRGWLEAMQALATEMVALPPPQVTATPSGPTAESRQDLSRFLTYAVAAIAVGLPLCAVVTFAAALIAASSR